MTEEKTKTIIRNSQYAIIAIHGGTIEKFTGAIAESIASKEHSLFIFKGQSLSEHITSAEFNHPDLTRVLAKTETVISVHGEHEENQDFIMVGGLDNDLALRIKLQLVKAGFLVKEPEDGLRGQNPKNVANRGRSKRGVQLEISRALRNDMLKNNQMLIDFADSIRYALKTDTI